MLTCAARIGRVLAGISVVALGLSCGRSPVESEEPWIYFRTNLFPGTDVAVAWATSATSLAVRASIPTPCRPYELAPSASRRGSDVTLRIEGHRHDGCTGVSTAPITYEAEMGDLPTGTIRLRVVHTHREWPIAPVTVFSGEVTIPEWP